MTKVTGHAAAGWSPVYRVVRRIPAGQVSTYGRVAALAGMPRAARQVGWALNALCEEQDVPWHRVINAKGEVSSRGAREYEGLQRALLESEGVAFDVRGRVDLGKYGWPPQKRETAGKVKAVKTVKTARTRKAGAKR